jgi:hypothetical protein
MDDDNRHSYWDKCEQCDQSVCVLVDSLEDQGKIPVICFDCSINDEDE